MDGLPTEIGSILNGLAQGKQLAGQIPGANMVGGAPPINDPAGSAFQRASQALMTLGNQLNQMRAADDANRVLKLATQLEDIRLTRKKTLAEEAVGKMDSGGLGAVGNLSAMGVPGGGQ